MEPLGVSIDPLINGAFVLGAVGTVAMVIVEFVKAIFRWRMRFHRYCIDRWLNNVPLSPEWRSRSDRLTGFLVEEVAIWRGASVMPPSRAGVKRELLALVAGGDGNAEAWYDQPSERLFARMRQAAQLAVDFPVRYSELYGFLTAEVDIEDDREDSVRWPELAPQLFSPGAALAGATDPFEKDQTNGDDSVAIRTRLGNLVAARIETLEHWGKWRSARSNQFLAFGLASVLFAWIDCQSKQLSIRTVVLSVVAGMTAPFAKDLAGRLAEIKIRR